MTDPHCANWPKCRNPHSPGERLCLTCQIAKWVVDEQALDPRPANVWTVKEVMDKDSHISLHDLPKMNSILERDS